MNLLIKDMDMPTDCAGCVLSYYYDGYNGGYGYCAPGYRCRALKRLIEEDKNKRNYYPRPSDCPLVNIPTPHGRLIDADRLYDLVEYQYKTVTGNERIIYRDLLDLICDINTVIEAEG